MGRGSQKAVEREKGGKFAFRERRQNNTNHKHNVIQDLMNSSRCITLGVITFGITQM